MLYRFWQWLLSLLPDSWTEPIEPTAGTETETETGTAGTGAVYSVPAGTTTGDAVPYTGRDDTSGGRDTPAGDTDDTTTPPTDKGTAGNKEALPSDNRDTGRGTAGQDYNGSGQVKGHPHDQHIDLNPYKRGKGKGDGGRGDDCRGM